MLRIGITQLLCAAAFAVVTLTVASAAPSGSGTLKLKVDPGRAGVFIDGKYVGPAGNFGMSRSYPVTPGEHDVQLVEPRYEEISQKVTITAGKTSTMTSKMKPLPLAQPPFGVIRVVGADKFSAVYVNGHYYGHAGEFNNFAQGVLVKPGDYTVRVVPVSGGKEHEQSIKVEAQKTSIVTCK